MTLLSRKKQPSSSTNMRANEVDTRRQQGSVVRFDVDKGYGFIKPDNDKSGNDIFFSRRHVTTRGQLPKVRDRVDFCMRKDIEGRHEATDILVQVNV
jgi:cold shock CspA family protein